MSKFGQTTPLNSEVISAHLLHFKAIYDSPLKKVVRGPPFPVRGALVRLGNSLPRVKIWGRSTSWGPKYGLPKYALSVRPLKI